MNTIENKVSVYIFEDNTGYHTLLDQQYLQHCKEIRTPHGYIYCDNRDARIPTLALPYIKKYNLRTISGAIYISPNSPMYHEILDVALIDHIKQNKCLPAKETALANYIGLPVV